jgi:hypothetical protein
MAPSDQDLLDLTVKTDCYKELDDTEHHKVDLAMQGKPASTPRSNIARVAFYLARRLHPVQTEPPPPPPPPPPPGVDKTLHAPLAYNQAPGGEPSARYNVHINCRSDGGSGFFDNGGVHYDEGGRCLGERDTVHVEGLKDANMMDGKESWDSYEWMGRTFPPYPDDCYKY